MMSAPNLPEGSLIWMELAVATLIVLATLGFAFATLRQRHRDTAAWHVWLGAAIQGAIFGLIIGFMVLPLRFALMEGEVPTQFAGPTGIIVILLVIALRRGLLARLPFLGPQVKAYRRASLRRTIENSQKQLDKLMPAGASLKGATG